MKILEIEPDPSVPLKIGSEIYFKVKIKYEVKEGSAMVNLLIQRGEYSKSLDIILGSIQEVLTQGKGSVILEKTVKIPDTKALQIFTPLEVSKMSVLAEKELLHHVDRKLYNAEGVVDYHTLQKHLNVKVKTIASAIGKTPRSLEKNPRSENIQKGLRKIVYILSLLKEMLESEAEILIWLKAPNPDFDGLSPWDVIAQGEMEAVIDYLIDMRKGALT